MWRCRRYIRFMRSVASAGHEVSAPISEEYARIHAPHIGCVAHSLLMFARQGCDRRALPANAREISAENTIPRAVISVRGCRKTAASARYPRQIADSGDG